LLAGAIAVLILVNARPGSPDSQADKHQTCDCIPGLKITKPLCCQEAPVLFVVAGEVVRPVSYRPVESDGAARDAACLAELI